MTSVVEGSGPAVAPASPRRSGAAWVTRLRLGSGLILFVYLTTHFANHALGLASLATMEAGRRWFLAVWRSPPGTLALYGALATHLALALWALYHRRHFRLPRWEATQLLLGLLIPPLLASHVIGTRLAHEWFGADDPYARVVLALWVVRPESGIRQAVLLLVAWIHGSMGLHFWLRLRPGYRRIAPGLFAAGLLLPVLALLGFAHAGREVSALARDPEWVAGLGRQAHAPGPEARAALERVHDTIVAGYAGAVSLALLVRAGRRRQARWAEVRLTYPGGREVAVPAGFSVLEASRFAGIPHASVCGGRGRCSTCRIRIVRGMEELPPPGADELRVLRRVGAAPNVRLACQLRPTRDLTVTPLLPADVSADGVGSGQESPGHEREIAVLFADLRRFTQLAEHRLPYDVVFILNRYFEAVGGAITRAGGIVNQFTGDGVMALFGVGAGPEDGARQALVAAGEIAKSLAELNHDLAEELSVPLRIGIGVHTGPAIVGRMGYGPAVYLTAVGDTVHVASRLEELTKEYECQLVISERVASRAGLDVTPFPRRELQLRGRGAPLAVRVVDDAQRVSAALASGPRGPSAAS
jgi:adenylate cyclase